MSDALDLLDQVSRQVWSLLRALHADVQRAALLAQLSAEPGHENTPLANRLLEPIDTLPLSDPLAASVLALVGTLIGDHPAAGALRLHGWDPGEGRPRSIALALIGSDPPHAVVLALDVDSAREAGLHAIAVIQPDLRPLTLAPGGNLTGEIRPDAAGTFQAWFGPQGARDLTPAGASTITCALSRDGHGPLVIGTDGAPRIVAQRLSLTPILTFAPPAPPHLTCTIEIGDAAIEIAPEWLQNVSGGSIRPSIHALIVSVDSERGLRFESGGTRAMLPASPSSPALAVRGIAVGIAADGGSAASLRLRLGLLLDVSPPGLPLTIEVDGAGAEFPLRLGAGQAFGFDLSGIAPLPADGIAGHLTLPFASGGGALMELPGGFGGAFDLDLGFVSVQAFAVLQNVPQTGFSFIVLMSARFPYPGIQLGFGFSLTGVGGVVGINRRLDGPALEAAILNGRANDLLFPSDPSGHALESIATLGSVFPPANGQMVVGPLLELSWGGRLVSLVLGLIFDLPDPPSFTILGRLTIALPDPALPAVFIQTTFAGRFDPSVPSTQFVATLGGSYIVGLPLRGDAMLLARGGSEPALVISAGGFHPAFPRPSGVPALRRIGCDLSPLPFPKLRAEVYFAFTASSVQFGAGLQLSGTIADCGVEGWFSFDALCQWAPVFRFTASCSGSVAVEVFGETLAAVSLSLTVEGPTPWRVHGTGTVSVLWEDVSLDFDLSWGSEEAHAIEAPDVAARLREAFGEASAWVSELATEDRNVATLSHPRDAEGELLHPLSGLVARQRLVPLDITIVRFQGVPVPPQRWHIAGGGLRADADVALGAPVTDPFAPAHYLDLSASEQLGARAFEPMTSGVELLPDDLALGPQLEGGALFETKLVAERFGGLRLFDRLIAIELAAVSRGLSSHDAHAERSWWQRADAPKLTVAAAQPVSIAVADSLVAAPVQVEETLHSYARTLQMVNATRVRGRRTAQLVERWELA